MYGEPTRNDAGGDDYDSNKLNGPFGSFMNNDSMKEYD
jgi:hypothetical protein